MNISSSVDDFADRNELRKKGQAALEMLRAGKGSTESCFLIADERRPLLNCSKTIHLPATKHKIKSATLRKETGDKALEKRLMSRLRGQAALSRLRNGKDNSRSPSRQKLIEEERFLLNRPRSNKEKEVTSKTTASSRVASNVVDTKPENTLKAIDDIIGDDGSDFDDL